MKCRQCGGPTQQKQTPKGVCYDCASGCVNPNNPKYALSTWPPRAKAPAPPLGAPDAAITQALVTLNNILKRLTSIEETIKSCAGMMPDATTPFNATEDAPEQPF